MPAAEVSIHAGRAPQIVASNGLPIREDVAYSDAKGEESERSRRRAQEAIDKLRDILPSLLEPKEAIFCLVRCQAPVGALEQLFVGWSIYQITATVLVFTNLRVIHLGVDSKGKWKRTLRSVRFLRVIHLGVDSKGKWKRTLRSVRWGDIAEARIKGWGSKVLAHKYASGKKENYWRLRRRDAKKVKTLLEILIPASRGDMTAAQEMVALCPDCRARLTPEKYRCESCRLAFKDQKTLLRRTLLIPGGGYWYAGLWPLGLMSFFGEGVLTLLVITQILLATGIVTSEGKPGSAQSTSAGFWTAAAILALLLALEKALAYIHTRRVIRTFLPLQKPGQV